MGMNRHTIALGIALGIGGLTFRCSENAGNPVGSAYFQRDNPGQQLFTRIQSTPADSFYQTFVPCGESSRLVIGQASGIQARSLLMFTDLPDSGRVDSAVVTLFISDSLGTVNENWTPVLYRVSGVWEDTSITWELFEQGNLLGEVLAATSRRSSDSLFLSLPPDLVQSWIDTATSDANYGFALTLESPDTGFVYQFYSHDESNTTSYVPYLKIYIIEDTAETTQTTLTAHPSADAFVATIQRNPDPQHLWVADGSALRSLLFFNLDSIPEEATINRALLILQEDTTLAFPATDDEFGVLGYAVSDSVWIPPDVAYETSLACKGTTAGFALHINITSIVQDWTSKDLPNYGLVLIGGSETTTVEARAFFSTQADSAVVPQLEIHYSLPPSSRMLSSAKTQEK
jgi:hypothetical protein